MRVAPAVLITSLFLVVSGCASNTSAPARGARAQETSQPSAAPPNELYRVTDEAAILAAARTLMVADENAALVTVDPSGQPRVRTVRAFPDEVDPAKPAKGMTVWIMTRRSTRKIEQIRQHPQVTLYFNNDATNSYLTIMGTAIVHTDPDNQEAKRFYDDEYAAFFWPELAKDFVMIQVKPRWIEFMGQGVPNHPETWRPQSVEFAP